MEGTEALINWAANVATNRPKPRKNQNKKLGLGLACVKVAKSGLQDRGGEISPE